MLTLNDVVDPTPEKLGLADRLLARAVETDGGCIEWTGCRVHHGYGQIWDGKSKSAAVHRVSYSLFVGPIPEGLTIDHLCRNTSCINPSHLEAVPQRTNNLRGTSPAAQNAAKTHCSKGHLLDAANTYIHPKRGTRDCWACKRERLRAYKARKRCRAAKSTGSETAA